MVTLTLPGSVASIQDRRYSHIRVENACAGTTRWCRIPKHFHLVRFASFVVAACGRAWNSASLTTWLSLSVRILGMAILMPLVLAKLPIAQANVWLLLTSIASLQLMADFGFSPTFVRAVSYAGASRVSGEATSLHAPLYQIVETMRRVYLRLLVVAVLGLGLVGTYVLLKPIGFLNDPIVGWIAWAVTLSGGGISFRKGMYSAFLQGLDKIAIVRRTEAISDLLGLLFAIVCLLLGGGLISVVASAQGGYAIAYVVLRRQALRADTGVVWSGKTTNHPVVMNFVWPAAWRSGLGTIMSFGVFQGLGMGYAQVATPSQSTSFLLALRLSRMLTVFSNVPFYVKVPSMARAYAEGSVPQLISMAGRGMFLTMWLVCGGVILIGFSAPWLLQVIGSEAAFVPGTVWWLISFGMILERAGAMHLQLFSMTNEIVWHIANGVAGAIVIVGSLLLIKPFGAYGVALSYMLSNIMFYAPYCMTRSYTRFGLSFKDIDLNALLLPLIFISVILAVSVMMSS